MDLQISHYILHCRCYIASDFQMLWRIFNIPEYSNAYISRLLLPLLKK